MKNMNNTKTTIMMIGLIMVVAGTILAPTQASALSKFNTRTDTSSLKRGISGGVNVNLEHRDQHMNQENLCYRINTCRQANDGQNTLGNDNSVTGFADQSDNIQQAAGANKTTPTTTTTTPANQTTGNSTTPTPTPTPTPIPGACGANTVFDVTLQAAIGTDLPLGTVLCLQVVGPNPSAIAIPPIGTPFTVDVSVSPVGANNQCPAGSVLAALTSGVLPSPLSGTTVCVI
jgi:hypothetical protein